MEEKAYALLMAGVVSIRLEDSDLLEQLSRAVTQAVRTGERIAW